MLRKRSRSKLALTADPNQKQSNPTSFPRLFTVLSSFKSFIVSDAVASPTSTLDPKPFSLMRNTKTREPETRLKLDPKPIGLAIVDSLLDEEKPGPGFSRYGSRTILFGSQLRIKVQDSSSSPADFGIKTRNNSQLGTFPFLLEKKTPVSGSEQGARRVLAGYFPAREMEQSEDYTCVTSHGPNPRTIHIFDDYIVESQSSVVFGCSYPEKNGSGYRSADNFLSICCTCKKNLGPGEDIFMYRGERAFCSSECRSEEMLLEEDNIL